jgi:hypothetical protein
MKKAIKSWTQKMQAELAAKGWREKFNPLSAPHMGG